jgi:hypothetical protein
MAIIQLNKKTTVRRTHKQRVFKELKNVGVTWYGMLKFAPHYLPKIIHNDEHIMGAVYGRYTDKAGANNWNEGMLVATDLRVIFLNHKPGYTKIDEMTYDVVSGVSMTTAGFSAVSLRTRLGDYKFRFANKRCSEIFVEYVERRRIEKAD